MVLVWGLFRRATDTGTGAYHVWDWLTVRNSSNTRNHRLPERCVRSNDVAELLSTVKLLQTKVPPGRRSHTRRHIGRVQNHATNDSAEFSLQTT